MDRVRETKELKAFTFKLTMYIVIAVYYVQLMYEWLWLGYPHHVWIMQLMKYATTGELVE